MDLRSRFEKSYYNNSPNKNYESREWVEINPDNALTMPDIWVKFEYQDGCVTMVDDGDKPAKDLYEEYLAGRKKWRYTDKHLNYFVKEK
jgi:hypothetical protein